MQLKPFTKTDWYGLAGAERFENGDEPLVAYFDAPSAVVIHDMRGIQVILYNLEGEYDDIYDLRGRRRACAAILASMTEADLTPEALTELGFERIG